MEFLFSPSLCLFRRGSCSPTVCNNSASTQISLIYKKCCSGFDRTDTSFFQHLWCDFPAPVTRNSLTYTFSSHLLISYFALFCLLRALCKYPHLNFFFSLKTEAKYLFNIWNSLHLIPGIWPPHTLLLWITSIYVVEEFFVICYPLLCNIWFN